jgi:hypothetical protein
LTEPAYKHVKIFQCQIDPQQFRLNLRLLEVSDDPWIDEDE